MAKIPITLYKTPNCVQCMMTAKEFDKLGIEYTTVDLTEHPDKAQEFIALGYSSAPIVTTDKKIWSGFKLEKIRSLSAFLFAEKRDNGAL